MIDRYTLMRWSVIGGMVAAVGIAGAATKLNKRPAAGDACLCTPDAQPVDLTTAVEPAPQGSSTASYRATLPGGSTSAAGALVPVPPSAAAAYGGGANAHAAAAGGGGGFGTTARFTGAYSASQSGGHSAALGGLWRLMSLSHRATPHQAATFARQATAARAPRRPKAAPPRTGGGSGGGTTTSPTAVGDLFAENTTTIPDLLGDGGNQVTAPGGPAGGRPTGDPGGLAATPEPGSLFLLGTGLLGVAGLLRRRPT